MENWTAILNKSQPWQTAYPIVAKAARAALDPITEDQAITTAALVALLWPGQGPRDASGKAAMQRLYRALAALAEHELAPNVKKGAPVKSPFGKMVQRNYWFGSDEVSEREALAILKEFDII